MILSCGEALIDMFQNASAKQGAQLKQATSQAVLASLQGRELSLKNIRGALKQVAEAEKYDLVLQDARGRRAVIRRPPMGELLPKAHDMGREWALISALGSTPVPVPKAYGFCEDTSVTGAQFYVMGHIDGHPLYSADDARRWAPEPLRTTLGHSFIDVLADLHAVDPDAVGLGDLGKKDDYIGRQLKTWYRSWNASIAGAQLDDPRAHALQKYFLEHVPDQGPARIVHGDLKPGNLLVGPLGDGKQRARSDPAEQRMVPPRQRFQCNKTECFREAGLRRQRRKFRHPHGVFCSSEP